jgi:hypothetical protein
MRLLKAAMAEASKQTTSPKRKQLRNVMTGQSLCAAAPLELPYATSSDGKISSLVVIFFIDLVSEGDETGESKQQLYFRQYQI